MDSPLLDNWKRLCSTGEDVQRPTEQREGLDRLVRRHWYAFSFSGKYKGLQCTASSYIGYEEKDVTKPRIMEAKNSAGVDEDSVLIACTYLGYMTRAEFEGA